MIRRPAHRCLTWALGGLLLGLAVVARGQDPTDVAVLADPTSMALLIDLLSGGGLPAVLALLGWAAHRWGGLPVVLRLHDDDRRLLRRLGRPDPDDSDHPRGT